MPYITVIPRQEIRDALERAGWCCADEEGGDWQHVELWRLQSVWAPVGAEAILTFLMDPMDAVKVPRPAIMAVVASERPLELRWPAEEGHTLYFERHWRLGLPTLVEYLAGVRNGQVQVSSGVSGGAR